MHKSFYIKQFSKGTGKKAGKEADKIRRKPATMYEFQLFFAIGDFIINTRD